MDKAGQDPLICSFERHLRAENRSARTIATYLIGLRQADAFLRPTAPPLRPPPAPTWRCSWPTPTPTAAPSPTPTSTNTTGAL